LARNHDALFVPLGDSPAETLRDRFGAFWLARQLRDEILLLVTLLCGVGFVVWGLVLAPLPLQLLVEGGSILALFSVCLGCNGDPAD